MAPHGGGVERGFRGDYDRRAPAVSDAGPRRAAVSGHQRERFGDQKQVRQPVRLPRIAGRRDQTGDRRDDRRQGGGRMRLRRRGQRLRREYAFLRSTGDCDRDRPDLRVAGRDGRIRGEDGRRRSARRQYLRHDDRQLRYPAGRTHGKNARSGDRLQHRAFRQRNPDG